VLGTERVRAKAAYLRRELGSSLIDLTTKTSLAQAFGVLQHVDCVISEDSGLMHMAWVSGIPTVVLFGSTKSYQSAPSGRHTFTFHSSDLECGNCGQPVCPLGTTECLNRLRPEQVLEAAKTAMSRRNS
jgi:ADP-heptose:LPS heptosyltransferase